METTKKELPELRKKLDTFKLIIPKEVEEKIRHLCRCIPTVEWSGKLFYKTEGSIANKDLVITCVDIYPMDIGSSGYTEFEETPDYFGYMVDKDLMDCNIGLIHSHNIMSTFFSGTDTNTLKEEGNDNNHFVSLIVNNAGVYTAAVTRKVTTVMKVVATDSFRTFDDSEVSIEGQREWEQTKDTIEYYMLDIEKEEVKSELNELDLRINELRQNKTKKKEKEAKVIYYARPKSDNYFPSFDRFNEHSFLEERNWKQPTLFDDIPEPKTIVSESQQVDDDKPEEYGFEVTEELVNNITTQLITGSVLISGKSNIDLKKFMETMESIYDKRFPDDPELYLYYQWIENFIEFLFMENIPDGLTVEYEKECTYELGAAISTRLEELYSASKQKGNRYMDALIETLDNKIDFL